MFILLKERKDKSSQTPTKKNHKNYIYTEIKEIYIIFTNLKDYQPEETWFGLNWMTSYSLKHDNVTCWVNQLLGGGVGRETPVHLKGSQVK